MGDTDDVEFEESREPENACIDLHDIRPGARDKGWRSYVSSE